MSFIVKKGGEEIQWRHWSQLQRQTEKKERLKTNKQTNSQRANQEMCNAENKQNPK